MVDSVKVNPGVAKNAIEVALREHKGVYYPKYISGMGDLTLDAWGAQKTSNSVSLFHSLFTYDVPPKSWIKYENGAEVSASTDIASENGALKILTTATNTELELVSRECPRYQPNRGHLYSSAGWFPNKTADGVRDFGIFTTENGVFFRLKSDGLLYAVLRSGSVEVIEEAIDTSEIPGFDVEKNNTYDIQFQWRSAGDYHFYIGSTETGFSKKVHSFELIGTLDGVSMENPAQPAAFKATRTTQDVSMYFGCVDITSESGLANNREDYASAYAENVSTGADTPIIIIRQPLLINSQTNTRTISLARITVNCSKKGVFKVWSTRDVSNITGATFKTIGGGSYIESDSIDMDATAIRATSVTVANLNKIIAIPVEATARTEVTNPYRDRIEFPIVRGDYLIVTCTATTATADCVIEWGEQV